AELDGAGAVLRLGKEGSAFLKTFQPRRQPGVDARREAPDEAGAQHEAMARDLGLRRNFLLGGYEELRSFHGPAGIVGASGSACRIVIAGAVWKNRRTILTER